MAADLTSRESMMASIKITTVTTMKAGTNSLLFDPMTEPLTLQVAVLYSQDITDLPNLNVAITYQILDLHTNQVAWQQRDQQLHIDASDLEKGSCFSVSLPAAYDLGLPLNGRSLFGFRAAVELSSFQFASGNMPVEGAFDVSAVQWFRLASSKI
jgi:hypothetical protein